MHSINIKKKIVENGSSKVFKDWSEHSTVTMEDFLEALQWVCNDPAKEGEPLTREIGLTPDGIVKIHRKLDPRTISLTEWFEVDTGEPWNGALFENVFSDEQAKKYGQKTIVERKRISINARDRI